MVMMDVTLILILIGVGIVSGQTVTGDNLVNKKVDRVIDISSQIVTITCTISVENRDKVDAKDYIIQIDGDHVSHVAFLEATLVSSNGAKTNMVTSKQSGSSDKWKIDLTKNPIRPGASADLIIVMVFTHLLEPYPTHISQADKQLVLYNGNHYFFSPYLTLTQSTRVKLPSGGLLESYTKLKPSSTSSGSVNLGPYENIKGGSKSSLQVHVENNSPFLTISRLERSIELSKWAGVISVEESIDLQHDGAVLKGPFSRYEFQREPAHGLSAVKSFRTKLPPLAYDIYYRDEIGNISTSNVRFSPRNVIADLRPRFPLFGGWKTHYTLGYYLPTKSYLFSQGSQFVLKIRFIDHVFDNFVIDEAVVNLILPEGASNIKFKLPYSVKREKDQVHKTYLDTFGRPKIVLRKSNLVEKHIQELQVEYTFNRLLLLQEPLLIVIALFSLCLIVSIYVRFDFSLIKTRRKDTNLKVGEAIEAILHHHSKRTSLYQRYDQASTKVKSTKDMGNYQTNTKQMNLELKHEASAIGDLVAKLKSESVPTDIMDKVNELQKLDRLFREQLTQQSTLIEKLIANRINKQLFTETENGINKKKVELSEKMSSIASAL